MQSLTAFRTRLVVKQLRRIGCLGMIIFAASMASCSDTDARQKITVNGVGVYMPRTQSKASFNTTATALGDTEIEYIWKHEIGTLMLSRNQVYFEDAYYGLCKPGGSVRVHKDGRVEVDGEFREPRSAE